MREFKTSKGTTLPLMLIQGKPYLSVQSRIVWFREEHPDWTIETKCTLETQNETKFEATIRDTTGRIISNAHKREDSKGFPDHYEKSESGAIGRALGFIGYGTAFALDLEEGERLADAPAEEKKTRQVTSEGKPYPIQGSSSVSSGTSSAGGLQSSTSDDRMLFVNQDTDEPGDYVVTFGKYKDKTIKEIAYAEKFKVSSYIQYLEKKAKEDGKSLSQAAQDFMEAFDAFCGTSELDQALERPIPNVAKEALEVFKKNNNTPAPPEDESPWPDHPSF